VPLFVIVPKVINEPLVDKLDGETNFTVPLFNKLPFTIVRAIFYKKNN